MNDDLPVDKDNFLAEVEVMDLSGCRGKSYLVAVGTGAPDKVKFLSSTVHGPYDFTEMLQEVGEMWYAHQHHAKVVILEKDANKKTQILHPNVIDYIECHYVDLITEEMLGGSDEEKVYTCKAGTVEEMESSDPRHKKDEVLNAPQQDPNP